MKIVIYLVFCIFIIPICGILYSKKIKDSFIFYCSITLIILSLWYVLLRTIAYFLTYNYMYFLLGSIIYYLSIYFIYLFIYHTNTLNEKKQM